MSSDKPEQEILDPKDSKNASLNLTTKKSQDSKLMLPPLGVKSEQQQPQQQQQTPLYGQQGSRKFKLNRSFKQTIRMPITNLKLNFTTHIKDK